MPARSKNSLIKNPSTSAALIAFVLMFASAFYAYSNRYYLRFIPVPLEYAGMLNKGNWLLPSSQAASPNGTLELPESNIQTEQGLRAALNYLQEMSPLDPINGMPNYTDITFDKWVREVTTKPFFCTDATQLFILTAWKQGLSAREWHLLPEGWPSGQGHSVAEFFNPAVGEWQLVDAQHGAIVRGPNGKPTNMLTVLQAFAENRATDIEVDYGPYRNAMLNGARGASSEAYFFEHGLLRTAVLQLRQATWLATTPRQFGLSGHFVIGYPVIVDGWTHDSRVWTSKLAVLLMAVFGSVGLISSVRTFRRLYSG